MTIAFKNALVLNSMRKRKRIGFNVFYVVQKQMFIEKMKQNKNGWSSKCRFSNKIGRYTASFHDTVLASQKKYSLTNYIDLWLNKNYLKQWNSIDWHEKKNLFLKKNCFSFICFQDAVCHLVNKCIWLISKYLCIIIYLKN